MKKFSLVLALAMALMLTIGVGVALAAPGDYPPNTTSDKYTTTLTAGTGTLDTQSWGLSNGLVNANQTGTGNVDKAVQGEKVHGEYANDTNSCASCHQTHTASGDSLLFKNGVYNTCTACHDGTLGAYNVFTPSNAGTFGGNPDKAVGNASVHLSTGVMTVSAAPGGNHNSTDPKTWGAEFTCASCHAPHGSYSDRLLAYDPNGVNETPSVDANGNPTGGRLMQNLSVSYDSATGKYTAVDANGNAVAGPWLDGDIYGKPKIYFTQIRVKDANGVFQYKYSADPTKSWNDVLTVNYRGAYFTDPNHVLPTDVTQIQMDVAPVTVVKMTETQIGTLPNGVAVTDVTGYTQGVNDFCSACHTDYNSNSAQTETGTFSKAFRHKITQGLQPGMIGQNGSMVCLTCHFAHGTDKTIQKDARDVVGQNLDVNPSSALKRYVNMSVCWKCHTSSKSDSLVNNNSYWDKVDSGTAPINLATP